MGVDADSRNDEEPEDERHPTDEEQVETEWHLWLFAILVLGGAVLVFFPPTIWPDLGFVFIAIGVVGWILKTVIEKTIR